MEKTASAVLERPANIELNTPLPAEIGSADKHLTQAAQNIATALTRVGYPQKPEHIAAQGEANTILAQMEKHGTAEVLEDLEDRLTKRLENTLGDVGGSSRNYSAEGVSGDKIFKGKISRKAIAVRAAQKFLNLLAKKRSQQDI